MEQNEECGSGVGRLKVVIPFVNLSPPHLHSNSIRNTGCRVMSVEIRFSTLICLFMKSPKCDSL